MNINRNNYEEFLLLYLDNELNSHQLNAVEIFFATKPRFATGVFFVARNKIA